MKWQCVDTLIEDLRLIKVYKTHVFQVDLVEIHLSADTMLLVYLPNSIRKDCYFEGKVIHLDIDILQNEYTKVLQRLRGLMGFGQRIYARNTVVARIDKRITQEFIQEYHLNEALSGKYRYGLYYKGELVSVAVFSGGRVMRDIDDQYRSFELLRFCHKADYSVIGGLSKLLKAFIADFKPNDIMTYADRDWTQESSLATIDFVLEGITEPQFFYIKDGKRLTYLEDNTQYDYFVTNRGSFKMKLYL